MNKYPLAKPNIGQKEKTAVLKVLDSGSLSLGPVYQKFEKAFAKALGIKYACAVSSGTAGLHLALIAAGIKAGDEVITTPFSFVASANAILYVGAKPVFVDIDPLTYNLDASKIEEKINKKTKAILVVHIFGQPAEMKPILAIARINKLLIIEDACESLMASYRGKLAGTFGQSAVFAFYPNKQITTGEGGMIVTSSKNIYELCCSLRNQGRKQGSKWLDHDCLGYNYRLDEMSAALGLAQLEKISYLISKRREIASWYNQAIKPYNEIMQEPEIARGNTHSWFVYVIKIKNKKINRNQVMEKLETAGIFTKPYLPSIHLLGFYRKLFNYKPGDFPRSEEISRSSLALPFYIGLTKKDCFYIIKKIADIINENRKK